jgi:acyl dehydratase
MTVYLEDLEIGATDRFGRYRVTRDEVLEFARKYDPQPFHLSDDQAAKTLFGRIAASGWHTAGITMRMTVDHWQARQVAILAGLGVDDLRWLKPVYPDDVLHATIEILDAAVSRSNEQRGVARLRTTTFNQHDEAVMTHDSSVLVATRPIGG